MSERRPTELDRPETRLGERVPRPGLALTVLVPARRTWRTRRPVAVVAPVVDLSVTGARLKLASAPPVVTGARLAVEHALGRGVVIVRHLAPCAEGVECGVEFLELDDRLRELVYERLAGDRAEEDWRWQADR